MKEKYLLKENNGNHLFQSIDSSILKTILACNTRKCTKDSIICFIILFSILSFFPIYFKRLCSGILHNKQTQLAKESVTAFKIQAWWIWFFWNDRELESNGSSRNRHAGSYYALSLFLGCFFCVEKLRILYMFLFAERFYRRWKSYASKRWERYCPKCD